MSERKVCTWLNSDRYEGFFKNEKRYSHDHMILVDGRIHEDNMNGQKLYRGSNDDEYERSFKTSSMHGYSTSVGSNGRK